jgi:NAD(P)-dependent dehydrogenase (short-subunit alcohol dehydrogenase family)
MSWTANEMPDLSGKTIVVTGANSGLGLEASCAFAGRGEGVGLACRNGEKAEAARTTSSVPLQEPMSRRDLST